MIGYHVYRSENENAPFEDWTRITENPIKDGNFNDSAETGKRFFYKLTEVDSKGVEGKPYTPKDRLLPITPEIYLTKIL